MSSSANTPSVESEPLLKTNSSQDSPAPQTLPNASPLPAHPIKEPVIHYSSISVDRFLPNNTTITRGTLKIIEEDLGAEDDLWNIHVHFIWTPRPPKNSQQTSPCTNIPVKVSVDQILVIRSCPTPKSPTVSIYLQGAVPLGHFVFPNGPDAAIDFVTTLRTLVHSIPLKDSSSPGDFFVVEKKHRMRHAAPSLMTDTAPATDEDDFAALLADLNIHTVSNTENSRHRQQRHTNRQQAPKQDFGMLILSQFARITQAAREFGDDISVLLDENKRRAERVWKEREIAARRRALDIYADVVASTDVERELPPRLSLHEPRGVPLSLSVWKDSFNEQGVLLDPMVIRQAIFSGGIEMDARADVWPFLLGFYNWRSSKVEREEHVRKMQAAYGALKAKWTSLQVAAKAEDAKSLAEEEGAVEKDRRKRVSKPHAFYLEIEEQITKDIVRTDRILDLYKQDDAPATLLMGTLLNVYATYNNNITYCQGMSDFLSPIIYTIGVEDESLVFWCFESLMRRIEGNFRIDQSGIRAQLAKLKKLMEVADKELADLFLESDPDYYSCFRWVLVHFKREFPFESISRLWEVLWTRQVGGDYLHIFMVAGLLIAHRKQLLALRRGAFDDMLRYVNDMSMRIDVDFAIREGELCFRKFADKVV